jgi:hypothetical protein
LIFANGVAGFGWIGSTNKAIAHGPRHDQVAFSGVPGKVASSEIETTKRRSMASQPVCSNLLQVLVSKKATATINANGNIVNVTIEGTYTVNPDCTDSMTRDVSPLGVTAHDDLVIDDDGVELRTIATDPGEIETYVYRKQFPGSRREW